MFEEISLRGDQAKSRGWCQFGVKVQFIVSEGAEFLFNAI